LFAVIISFANAFYEVRRSDTECYIRVDYDGSDGWLDISNHIDSPFFNASGSDVHQCVDPPNCKAYISAFALIYSPCKLLECDAYGCLSLKYLIDTGEIDEHNQKIFSEVFIPNIGVPESHFINTGKVTLNNKQLKIDFNFKMDELDTSNLDQTSWSLVALDMKISPSMTGAKDFSYTPSFEVNIKVEESVANALIKYHLEEASNVPLSSCPISLDNKVSFYAFALFVITLIVSLL